MRKYKCHSLIIGGTGQFGITLKNQLNKKIKRLSSHQDLKNLQLKKKILKLLSLTFLIKKKFLS